MYAQDWITENVKIEHDGAYFIVELRVCRKDKSATWIKSLRTIGEYENKHGANILDWIAVHAPDAFVQISRRAIAEVGRI